MPSAKDKILIKALRQKKGYAMVRKMEK